jgi:hypothetical protein
MPLCIVVHIRIRDPVTFFSPWIRVRDEHPASYFRELRNNFFGLKMVLKFFDADADPGSEIFLSLDRGSRIEKFRSGIREKHPGSATLSDVRGK